MKRNFYTILATLPILFACNSKQAVIAPALKSQSKSEITSLANTLDNRWQQTEQGITWQVQDIHEDHIEMSGEQVSAIIYYGNDDKGRLTLKRKIVWPMLRTIPNDTHASYIHDFDLSITPTISLNGQEVEHELLTQVDINGTLTLKSTIKAGITITRTLAPSPTKPLVIEQITIKNDAKSAVNVSLGSLSYQHNTPAEQGVYGSYKVQATSDKSGDYVLSSGKGITVNVDYKATKKGQVAHFNSAQELLAREAYVDGLKSNLQLVTPDPVINQMFEFAKLRSAESIFRTKGGLMHGPGGGRYYAAIWANDQAEYINPFFPFLGDINGNESAINSFYHFARFMNDQGKYIPSSIIAEGTDIWDGAGDRGDCAMIAYGASRFALAYGDKAQATELLPLINWCIDYSFMQETQDGVIASDSDELEGRFPAGDVNLSTNMLTYGSLISASYLHQELGHFDTAKQYETKAVILAKNIEKYFGANVQGYETYQYYQGNEKLRAWIALPFTFGIFERKEQTLAALLSEHLWSEDGIYSEAGNKTFWDRATLYAFRGIFNAKETDTAMRYFKYYSRKRLLGEHVPYAVEAWPEGNQRHLSAESALYARAITEGLFGIEPIAFNAFYVAPYLPSSWNEMCLNSIRAFSNNFDICVKRDANNAEAFQIIIQSQNTQVQHISWDGNSPIKVTL
ncbi:hypothetical protein [Colwellia sp. RSH04]|uniref:hypothetical protein n=1 Tax=Colwellia sp. RSH04 TaxID=2305464 RepID=UPI000E56CC53|nr:hypothetical protein [Colwellia sp. RSH04]RHW76132.1 hypothetical protein D1094_10770 [Colwellia sp. RSH04]